MLLLRRHRFLGTVLLSVCVLGSGSALAQADSTLPGISPGAKAHPAPKGKSYLERRYGLSRAEAERRQSLEAEVSTLAEQLAQQHAGDFIGSVIEHQPNYRVTLIFSSDIQLNDLRADVPPSLRSSLKVRRSKYSQAQIDENRNAIRSVLDGLRVPYSLSYDLKTDKFNVTVDPNEEKVNPSLFPPALRSDINIRKLGAPSFMQTGVQPGDPVYGGWDFYDQNNAIECTYSFVIRDSSARQGITTAAHCPTTSKIKVADTRYVTLPAPFVNERSSNTTGKSYDSRAHLTTGMTTGPWVWYWNERKGTYRYYLGTAGYETRNWANGHPAYDIRGNYFHVIGAVTGASSNGAGHPVGAVRCKNGVTTGFTCGEITSSYTDTFSTDRNGNTVYYGGYVEVGTEAGYADHMVIAYGGDSGGPTSTEPLWNATSQQYEIRASGSLVGGNTRPAGAYRRPCVTTEDTYCYFVYMPIDRINDRVPMQVVTASGSVSP